MDYTVLKHWKKFYKKNMKIQDTMDKNVFWLLYFYVLGQF
jgi:hypothetical protein